MVSDLHYIQLFEQTDSLISAEDKESAQSGQGLSTTM